MITKFFFPKEIENEVYKNPLYSKGTNPTTLSEDYELRVEKDSLRHDTLLMNVTKDENGELAATSKITIA
ncbi:MAG: hypothetical protein ABIO76_11745 [Ginsengibacter sp.]